MAFKALFAFLAPQPLHRFDMPVLFGRITFHHAISVVFVSRLCLSTPVLKNDILYIYIWEERPHFVPSNPHRMLFMFLLVRHGENVIEKSSWLQSRSVLEMFLKILFISRVKRGIQLQYVYQTLEYSAWVISIYIYSICTYTVLGFTVPFEYFYCKKDSGFEIVENKCIFVHQSYILGWGLSLLMIFFFTYHIHQTWLQYWYAVTSPTDKETLIGTSVQLLFMSLWVDWGLVISTEPTGSVGLLWMWSALSLFWKRIANSTWGTLKHSVAMYPFCQPVYLCTHCHVQHQGLRDTSSCIGSHY